MIKWKTLADMPCSAERAKELGYDAWKKDIKLALASGQVGDMKEGTLVLPTEADIKAKYNVLLGIKEEAVVETIKKEK
jgi:hypothetical protein